MSTTASAVAPKPEQLRHIVDIAGLAPSVHNTQPWRFVVTPFGLELHADPKRQLSQLDPLGRQLRMSCGAALHHAEVAARALGLDMAVQLVDPSPGQTHLADLVLSCGAPPSESELRLATAVLHRHTHRGAFDGRRISAAVLNVLRAAVESQGAIVGDVQGDDLINLDVLLSRASHRQEEDPRYRAELRRWVHSDPERDDGIPVAAATVVKGSDLRQRDFTLDQPPALDGTLPRSDHPQVLVLATTDDGPAAWLRSGRALAALLLHAADHGVQAQPLGQVTDADSDRAVLRVELGLVAIPQLVLRLGYAPRLALTPRRPVESVMAAVAD